MGKSRRIQKNINTPSSQARLYDDLAWLWPVISPPEDYLIEALQFASLIRQYISAPYGSHLDLASDNLSRISLLHLGCGGGHLDYHLKKYFQITSVDLSQNMLSLASLLNPEVVYLHGDMRTVCLEETFDAVMIADSIDYMLCEDDLRSTFMTAYRRLKPGGILITYAEEVLDSFENNRTDSSTHTRDDLEVTLVENLYDPDPSDSTYEMLFIYIIRQNGRLTIEADRHTAGIFSLQTWHRLFKETGFQTNEHRFEADSNPYFIGLKSGSQE